MFEIFEHTATPTATHDAILDSLMNLDFVKGFFKCFLKT